MAEMRLQKQLHEDVGNGDLKSTSLMEFDMRVSEKKRVEAEIEAR